MYALIYVQVHYEVQISILAIRLLSILTDFFYLIQINLCVHDMQNTPNLHGNRVVIIMPEVELTSLFLCTVTTGRLDGHKD